MSQYNKLDTSMLPKERFVPDAGLLSAAENQGLKAGYIDPLGGGLLKAAFMKAPVSTAKKVHGVIKSKVNKKFDKIDEVIDSSKRKAIKGLGLSGAVATSPASLMKMGAKSLDDAVSMGVGSSGLGQTIGGVTGALSRKAKDIAALRNFRMAKNSGMSDAEAAAATKIAIERANLKGIGKKASAVSSAMLKDKNALKDLAKNSWFGLAGKVL